MQFGTDNVEDKSIIVPAPRIEGCILSKVGRGDYNGKSTLDITFKDSTGATLTHREFDPSEKWEGDSDEKHQQKIQWCMSRVKHILGRFVSEAEATIASQPTWEAFLAIAGKKLKAQVGKTCTLKVVYNKKFPSFPMFPDFISTEAFPKTFKIDPDYDKFELTGEGEATSAPTAKAKLDNPFDDEDELPNETSGTNTTETVTDAVIEEEDDDMPF